MYGQIMKYLTQIVILPLIERLIKYFMYKLEQHEAAQKLKAENKKKAEDFKNAKGEEVKTSFEKLP